MRVEDDGTARVEDEATPDAIDEFEDHLRAGPTAGGGWEVRPERKQAEGLPDPFEVRS